MPARTRTKDKIKSDRTLVASLSLQGWCQKEIAKEIGVCQQQVAYDLKVIQLQWRSLSDAELTELRAKELAKIDLLEKTYWQAWHDSKKPTKSTKQSKKIGSDVGSVEKKTECKNGNPAYLQGVERCVGARVRILGLDSANAHAGLRARGNETIRDLAASVKVYSPLSGEILEIKRP